MAAFHSLYYVVLVSLFCTSLAAACLIRKLSESRFVCYCDDDSYEPVFGVRTEHLPSVLVIQPQQPELNDQFKTTDLATDKTAPTILPGQSVQKEPLTQPEPVPETVTKIIEETVPQTDKEKENDTQVAVPQVSFTVQVYKLISEPIIKVVNTPKVNEVLRNIGICAVNGAMELFSYYLPAPLMPLLATAAGLVIPFEPVVMLKERMPVTSYRRAFQTAMNTFLRTFDKYKIAEEYDPYMTRRFNRRYMNDNDNIKEAGKTAEPAEF